MTVERDDERDKNLNDYAHECHIANRKWWINMDNGEPLERNKGELLMLMVSEIAEAMEGERKDLMDDKLPHRKMFDVEIVDACIRLFDIAGAMIPDFGLIYNEKMAYNATRHDHTIEGRKQAHGKKY